MRFDAIVFALSAAAPLAAQAPARWDVSGTDRHSFVVSWDSTIQHSGRASIRISASDEPDGFVGIAAVVPATPYANRIVRLTAYLRARDLGADGASLWLRANAAGKPIGFASTQGTSPLRGTAEWTAVALTLAVPPQAEQLYFGAFSAHRGTVWIDDMSLEGLEPPGSASPAGAAAPAQLHFGFDSPTDVAIGPQVAGAPLAAGDRARALSARGLANIAAFAEAMGYVRFFHPAPEAVTVNWDRFAIAGVRAVEDAPTPDSLAHVLAALFAPIAPTVRIAAAGARAAGAAMDAPHRDPEASGVIYWQHYGIGAPSGGPVPQAQNVYKSIRTWAPISSVGAPARLLTQFETTGADRLTVPDPAKPLSVDLGAGVSMRLPLAVYSRDSEVPESARTYHPSAGGALPSLHDRSTRFADVVLLWTVMEHFYPYFDVGSVDWPGALRHALTETATAGTLAESDVAMEHLISALHDGHGNVNRATSSRTSPDVRLGWVEGRVVITAAGDSARAQGIRVGDEVVTIDGQAAGTAMTELSTRVSAATPQFTRAKALALLLAGAPATEVALVVRDAVTRNAPERTVHLVRRGAQNVSDTRAEKIAELQPGVFYVDLDRITDADFNSALPRLAAASGIIFDMRGYPMHVNTPGIFAHLTDSVIHSAHFEIPVIVQPAQPPVAFADGRWTVRPAAPRLHAHIVFLTGGSAVSYAESTMGIVEAYRLGEIVGEPSAGTNGNVNPFTLPGGYYVAWTGMRVTKNDGSRHHGVGIQPTMPVTPTLVGVQQGRDEVLERAVKLLTVRPVVP